MQLLIIEYLLFVDTTKTGTSSTLQKSDTEPLRAIENISTTITPSAATSSTLSTTTTTASAASSAGDEDDAGATVASTNSILAKSEKELLPKAMIKPNNVLTHVIGDMVIQESNKPFPVIRQRYADDNNDTPGESSTYSTFIVCKLQ